MKTKRYLTFSLFALMLGLLVTSDLMAQPRRYRGGGYGYSRGYPRNYYGGYYPYRSYGYNRPFVSVQFGGVGYRYQQGYFYRPYGSSFQVVLPPIGVRIATLPAGYRQMYVGPDPYYFYNGTYYRSLPSDEYEVVAPPLGATVNSLPTGAKVTVIDGQKYYELNGTYYQEEITDDNKLIYTVVGTDGVLDTTGDNDNTQEPKMGDRFETLPADAKPVVIQGEKFYTTPSGLYYKEVVEDKKVYYEVVGE
ncbi:MAG: hypothetical protein EOO05_01655 [Chitinophagaceae bacterium]|nr:MAG: hypothetical protein EOO05_01655 [Chitinophagaceae bacterium]